MVVNGKVSIIIPTYKGSNKLMKTLDGIRGQDYHNIETVVVDDNGLDTDEQRKTSEIIKRYPEITYIVHKTNKNGSAARNTGMANSDGEYIAFLDDDDTWMSNKISQQVETLKALPTAWGAVYCPYMVIKSPNEAYLYKGGKEGNILYDYLVENVKIASSSILIRRNVLNEIVGFDESFRRHQDWEFIARIASKYKIAYSNKTMAFKHDEIRRNSPRNLNELIEYRVYYLKKMQNIISSLSLSEEKKVYSYHYSFIAKECLRRRKGLSCMKWLMKTSNPLTYGLDLAADVMKYIYKKHNLHSPESVLQKYYEELEINNERLQIPGSNGEIL